MSRRYGLHNAKVGRLLIACAVALATSTAAAQAIRQPEESNGYQQGAQAEQNGRSLGVTLACAPSPNGRDYTCYRQTPSDPPTAVERLWRWTFRLWRDPIAVLTLALFIIGGFQIRISDLTAKRQLRAYLYLDEFAILDGSTINPPDAANIGHPGIALAIRNSGETPASNVFHSARMEVRPVYEEGLLSTPAPANLSRTYAPRNGVILKTIVLGRSLAPQELAGLASGTHAIYLLGRIDYRDAFKKKRFTTYRLRYIGAYPPGPNAQMVYCDEGNGAG